MERPRPLQVGDRCFVYGTEDVVVIDSVKHFGIPECCGVTFLTGPKKGRFTIAYEQDLEFSYPESEAGSHAEFER